MDVSAGRSGSRDRRLHFGQFVKSQGFYLEDWQLELAQQILDEDEAAPTDAHGSATTRALVELWKEAA